VATLAVIRKDALELLGRANPYDTVDSTLDTDIGDAYTQLWNELETRQLAFWGLTEDVPDRFVRMVKYLLAYFYGGEVAVSDTRWQRIVIVTGQDGEKGFKTIRQMGAGTNTNPIIAGQFY